MVPEDPTCLGATQRVHNYRAYVLQLLKSARPRAHASRGEKPPQWEARTRQLEPPLIATREKPAQQRSPSTARNKIKLKKKFKFKCQINNNKKRQMSITRRWGGAVNWFLVSGKPRITWIRTGTESHQYPRARGSEPQLTFPSGTERNRCTIIVIF